METNQQDDDFEETDDEEDEEDQPPTPRRKRVSGLVKLTGKPKTPQKSTPKTSRIKNTGIKDKKPKNIPTGDMPRPPVGRHTQRQRDVGVISGRSNPVEQRRDDPTVPRSKRPIVFVSKKLPVAHNAAINIPDSGGEENDIWVISSEND
jgi:hypothetical protein